MRLYINKSPYGRVAAVAAHETGLLDRIAVSEIDPWSDPAELIALTPLSRVPLLVTADGAVLGESSRICEHLDTLAGGGRMLASDPAQRLSRLHLAGLAQGMADAAVALVLERKRPSSDRSCAWMQRQNTKIVRVLAHLEATEFDNGAFDLAGITLACTLSYISWRLPELGWTETMPRLAAWYAEAAARPSMRFAAGTHRHAGGNVDATAGGAGAR